MTVGVVRPRVLRSSRNAMPSLPGMTTSEKMRSKRCALTSSSALAALSQTVASWPAMRKARAREASVLASSSTMRRCAILQFDAECCAAAGLAGDGYPSSMIADYGLYDGEAQARAVLFGRVVRGEQALAFFPGEPGPGVGDLETDRAGRTRGTDREDAARRHGVERVQHQILERAMKLGRIGFDVRPGRIRLDAGRDALAGELRFEQFHYAAHDLVEAGRLPLRWRHFGKIAEAIDDGLEIG